MLQHRLAKFYLRGFTRRAGARVLQEYRKGLGFAREVSPKIASAEIDVFEVEGVASNTAERFFGRVETFAKGTFEVLRNRRQPTKLQREKLAVFMALCLVRSSKRAAENEELARNITLTTVTSWVRHPWTKIRWLLAHPRMTSVQYDEMADMYLHGLSRADIDLPRPLRGDELSLVNSACMQWASCLEGTEWSVEIAEGANFFIVPDEPLVTRRKNNPFDPSYVGINRYDLGAETTFPLNRRMCLILAQGESAKPVTFHPASSARVEEINLRSIIAAHKLIFSPVRTEAVDKLVASVGEKSISLPMPEDLTDLLSDVPL